MGDPRAHKVWRAQRVWGTRGLESSLVMENPKAIGGPMIMEGRGYRGR